MKPVLQHFGEEILRPEDDDRELTKAIKTTYLNEKFNDAATDTLVDPRFKTCYTQTVKIEAVRANAVCQMLDE